MPAPGAGGAPLIDGTDATARDFLELADWRRRVSELYAAIRADPAPAAAWALWRRARDEMFRHHPQSPLPPAARAAFAGLDYFDYAPALRFAVDLAPPPAARPSVLDAGPDGAVTLRPFALTRGLAGALGGELTLYWIAGYGGGAFLPFLDATSGAATYGGGRYLLDTIKGADLGAGPGGRTILDFNFAYNPSCAYSARWACPLATAANRLPRPVAAGERRPRSPA